MICVLQTSADTLTGQQPQAGDTYYIYNVGAQTYLAVDANGLTSLSATGSPFTLTAADDTNNEGAYFLTTASGQKLATSLVGAPTTDGTGKYDHWMLQSISGAAQSHTYAIGCRIPEASAVAFLYYDNVLERIIKLFVEPHATYVQGQWLFISKADYDRSHPTVVDLQETATAFSVPSDSPVTVHLYRSFTLNAWNTLTLPFALTLSEVQSQLGSEARVAAFESADATTLHFRSTSSIEAGQPYLVYVTADPAAEGYYTFSNVGAMVAQPSDVTCSSVTFHGSFVQTTAPQSAYVIRKNEVYQLVSDMTMKGFRAYFIDAAATQEKLAQWTLDGTTMVGSVAIGQPSTFDVYNLNGQLVRRHASSTDGMPKGVYLINNKKQVIR